MLLHMVSLFLAIGLTPWLISQLVFPRNSWSLILAWGPSMVAVNVAVLIALHLLVIPITPDSLALAHSALAGGLIIISIAIGLTHPCPSKAGINHEKLNLNKIPSMAGHAKRGWVSSQGSFILGPILFALLVLPLTHIAGIDTYKWQDLASNIAVEQRISWLVHPLSLLGFTPRSYSSAQPLVLASIQLLGHTGIDWGFYLLSLTFGLTGFCGAWILGRYLFKTGPAVGWFAWLYLFSPVFMRYNYWATGRGLLLALLPLYLLVLLKLGAALTNSATPVRRSLVWLIPAWLFMTGLLMMSHKAGVVGALLIPILLLISPLFSLIRERWSLWLVCLLALAIGLLLANGHPLALGTRLLTRFGWLFPLSILAIVTLPERFRAPPFRAILVAGLGTLILSCTPDMYGALLALPFIAGIATVGLEKVIWRPVLIRGAILIPALAIVLNQMRDSPSESVYRAARYIEQIDPRGPFRIEAPGPARHQIQAYVSGCPRFTVHAEAASQVKLNTPPVWTGHLAPDARRWIGFLRGMLEVEGANTDWYGSGAKIYYVTIGGQGIVPQNAKRLFTSSNVSVFE